MWFVLRKAIAYGIDYVIVMIFVGLFTFCAEIFYQDPTTASQGVLMLICALITVLSFTTYVPTKTNGQTIGQKLMKVKVVNKNGTPRNYFQSFIRECVVKISAAPIFIIFTVCYFGLYAIAHRSWEVELQLDFIIKTNMIDLKPKKSAA